MTQQQRPIVTDVRHAVHTPAEASARGVERIREMEANKHRSMPLDIPKIGEYLAPLMPGELCAVQAQSSNYKSGFMNMWEHQLAKHLQTIGRDDECIIHVDTETSVESLAIQEIGRLSGHSVADLSRGNVRDWKDIIQAAGKIAGIPIYRIAASLGADDMPDLYLSSIYRAIKLMQDSKVHDHPIKPACIFVDYLQALPIDPEVKAAGQLDKERRLQVRQDVYRLRSMANYFACPVVVGVQAKQEMKGHPGQNMMIPGTYDGEETSSIAQRFDRIISLWMPKMTHTQGETITHKQVISFEVTDDLIFIKVNKQRGGLPSGDVWPCRIDYKTNTIAPTKL